MARSTYRQYIAIEREVAASPHRYASERAAAAAFADIVERRIREAGISLDSAFRWLPGMADEFEAASIRAEGGVYLRKAEAA